MATNDLPYDEKQLIRAHLTNSPSIHVSLPASSKIPRSPSRESIATELSLYSVSSLNSDFPTAAGARLGFGSLRAVPEGHHRLSCLTPNRGPSPIPGRSSRFLKVPTNISNCSVTSPYFPEAWTEEESDLNVIKSCTALSASLGLQKSFSTGDIPSYGENGEEVAGLCYDSSNFEGT